MMQHQCPHCHSRFTAMRKDKIYCSLSCKQMAFVKRQEINGVDFLLPKSQNVNLLNRQVEPSINDTENINLLDEKIVNLVDFEDDDQIITRNINTSALNIDVSESEKIYMPIKCKWIAELYNRYEKRQYYERFNMPRIYFKDKMLEVDWVSIHYRCLIECVLTLANIKMIEWNDIAELTNSFTFLTTCEYFKVLPFNYPYIKEMIALRDKLKSFCIETQDEEFVQFHLKSETKHDLLLQKFELAFPKITFNELQRNFKTEFDKQQARMEDKIKSLEDKSWQRRYQMCKK